MNCNSGSRVLLGFACAAILLAPALTGCIGPAKPSAMGWISVSSDGRGFINRATGAKFVPWGFNYDHDESGRLLEDYWDAEWPKVEADFREMKALGANVVRVHLQVGRFLESPARANARSLARYRALVQLAERTGLYLDVTGLGCYHQRDVPAWYDALDEAGRWAAQAVFWEAVAREGRNSSAIFCYDLMNEPVAPAGRGKGTNWLGPAFGDKHFVQWISLEARGREREMIARAWVRQLTQAIRKVDARHLVTVGLVDWSLPRPGKLYSGFAPEAVAPELDFLCLHLYPEKGRVDEALETLRAFNVGKPVVIEETYPLKTGPDEFRQFIERATKFSAGVIGFYWGATPEELAAKQDWGSAFQLAWLNFFQEFNLPTRVAAAQD
jgi:hypothetical protein